MRSGCEPARNGIIGCVVADLGITLNNEDR